MLLAVLECLCCSMFVFFQPRKCLLSTRSGGSWSLLLWSASSSSSSSFSSSLSEVRVRNTPKKRTQVGNATDHHTFIVLMQLKPQDEIGLHFWTSLQRNGSLMIHQLKSIIEQECGGIHN